MKNIKIVINKSLFEEVIYINFIDGVINYTSLDSYKNIELVNPTSLIKFIVDQIIYWENEYINNNILDGITVKIFIEDDNGRKIYNFINRFPSNYSIFIDYIKELVGV